jgi:hypothetical protein
MLNGGVITSIAMSPAVFSLFQKYAGGTTVFDTAEDLSPSRSAGAADTYMHAIFCYGWRDTKAAGEGHWLCKNRWAVNGECMLLCLNVIILAVSLVHVQQHWQRHAPLASLTSLSTQCIWKSYVESSQTTIAQPRVTEPHAQRHKGLQGSSATQQSPACYSCCCCCCRRNPSVCAAGLQDGATMVPSGLPTVLRTSCSLTTLLHCSTARLTAQSEQQP